MNDSTKLIDQETSKEQLEILLKLLNEKHDMIKNFSIEFSYPDMIKSVNIEYFSVKLPKMPGGVILE